MYLTAVGYGMIAAGIVINIDIDIPGVDVDTNIPDYVKLYFAGGFLTTLFWV